MLPKQRVVAALTFSRPDRIPMGETGVDYPITEQALGRPTLYRGKWKEYQVIWQGRRDEYVASCKRDIVALAHKFEHDFVPVFLVPSRHKPTPEPEFLSAYRWRLPDGRVYRFSPETEGHAFLESAPPVSLVHLLEVPSEIDDSELELVEHIVRELGDTHFIVGRLPSGVFPIDRYLFEDMLTGMIDHPDMIRRILELETAYNLVAGERLLAAGCDAIMDLSDVAGNNGPFMSPRMFEEFICPHLKSQAELAHSRGRFSLKHTDGNMWRLLDLMIEAGVDAWHGIQPKIGMELPKLQALCWPNNTSVLESSVTDVLFSQHQHPRLTSRSFSWGWGWTAPCGRFQTAGSKTFIKLFISPHHRDWTRDEPRQRRTSVRCVHRFDSDDVKAPEGSLFTGQLSKLRDLGHWVWNLARVLARQCYPDPARNSSAVTFHRFGGDAWFTARPARDVDGSNPIYGYKFRKPLLEPAPM